MDSSFGLPILIHSSIVAWHYSGNPKSVDMKAGEHLISWDGRSPDGTRLLGRFLVWTSPTGECRSSVLVPKLLFGKPLCVAVRSFEERRS